MLLCLSLACALPAQLCYLCVHVCAFVHVCEWCTIGGVYTHACEMQGCCHRHSPSCSNSHAYESVFPSRGSYPLELSSLHPSFPPVIPPLSPPPARQQGRPAVQRCSAGFCGPAAFEADTSWISSTGEVELSFSMTGEVNLPSSSLMPVSPSPLDSSLSSPSPPSTPVLPIHYSNSRAIGFGISNSASTVSSLPLITRV